jgi:hypothetical protein
MVCICNPSYRGDIARRILVQGQRQAEVREPIQKITRAKLAEGVAQVVECLPSKLKALSSIPSTATNKQKPSPGRFLSTIQDSIV